MCEVPEAGESELVRGLQAGDLAAFDELFRRHRRGLLAYAVGLLGDRALAEDVVQDSFVRLARSADRIDPARGARPWLYRVAHNRAVDLLRRRRREPPASDADLATLAAEAVAADPSPADGLIGAETRRRVRAALDRLPEKEREVLLMRFYGELTFQEAARVARRPLGTMLWRASRALQRLREMMGESG
jgi:RNA polymerase sigma-70 factor (ECF subfamily)